MNIKGNTGSGLLLLLLLACVIGCSPAAGADPILPHLFHGEVSISSLPAPAGTHITAEAGGIMVADYTTEEPGIYGSTELTGNKFKVQGAIANGDEITFFIEGVPAACYPLGGDGSWHPGYPFNAGEETEMNLSIAGTFHTITATAGTGGTIAPLGSILVLEGTDRAFSISPDQCHAISTVLVNGNPVGAVSGYTFTNVTADQTIHADFSTRILSVTASAGPGGSISPYGVLEVPCGETMSFSISPSPGYVVHDVLVDGVSVGAQTGITVGPVTGNMTVEAYFTPAPLVPYTIHATAGSHGNITPEGEVVVNYGSSQSFTMKPDIGYTVDQILVDGSPVVRAPVYTFQNVVSNHTIEVSFMEGAPEYFAVELGDGWNLFSTPITLGSGHQYLEDIFPPDSLEHIEVILGWDGSVWFIPGYGYELDPLTALYVKVQGSATAVLYPSQDLTMPPTRTLPVGWSLIGPAPDYHDGGFSQKPVEDSLITIYGDASSPGYLIVVSPGINQPGWSYVRDGGTVDLLPFRGYWVYMENQKNLAGFSTTPIS